MPLSYYTPYNSMAIPLMSIEMQIYHLEEMQLQ